MTFQQFFQAVAILVAVTFIIDLYKINHRILCRFTGKDKRVKKKWVKPVNGERIEFDKGWYYVATNCIRHDTTWFGLLPVILLEFNYKSKYPLDPDTGEPLEETPEMRRNLDKREDIQAYNEGGRKAAGLGKVSVLGGGLLPIILVIGIIASLYLNYQAMGKIDMLGNAINVLQQMMMK